LVAMSLFLRLLQIMKIEVCVHFLQNFKCIIKVGQLRSINVKFMLYKNIWKTKYLITLKTQWMTN
jgi:hypothetical protein